MKSKLVILNRLYPSPSGRTTFIDGIKNDFSDKCNVEILSFHDKYSFKIYSLSLGYYFLFSFYKLIKMKPDVILGVGLSSLGGIVYGRLVGVWTIFNLSDTNKRALSFTKNSFKRKIGMFFTSVFEGLCLSLSDLIVVPSESSKRFLIEDYSWVSEKKIKVICEGVKIDYKPSADRKRLGYSDKDILLLFPWGSERKNVGFFISCLPMLMKKNVKVIFLGDKIQISNVYYEIINSYKNNIIFTGNLNIDEKYELFSVVDLLIYIPRSEAHSYTILEALHFKLPILLSRVGWLKDEFKDYPFYIDSFDCEALKKSVFSSLKFDGYNSLRSRMLKKYDYDKMVDGYWECLGIK